MKTFAKKVIIYVIIFAVIDICFCAIIDPFNVMHTSQIRDNGVEPNKNYIKMTYVISNPYKFNSFVFGSSRVGSIHVEKNDSEHCYNMTYSQGLPAEHLDNIRTLFSEGIIPQRIYIGIDSLSYTLDPEDHLTQAMRAPYEYLSQNRIRFFKMYFDPAMVQSSVKAMINSHAPKESYTERFYNYGWDSDYCQKTEFVFDHATPSIGEDNRMTETLNELSEIASICKANGVELVVFTNPMYWLTYRASLEKDYLSFLEQLAYITPYFNFSGYNQITTNSDNYYDTSHYTAEIGDKLIECMCFGKRYDDLYKDGFGVYVTKDNIKTLLEVLENQCFNGF